MMQNASPKNHPRDILHNEKSPLHNATSPLSIRHNHRPNKVVHGHHFTPQLMT